METISLANIAQKLQAAITGKIGREDAANWALRIRESVEVKKILSEPARDENLIWDSLLYLEGIDLQDFPDSYLHNTTDLTNYLRKIS
ncbi:hypothetical protein [Hymenobacter psoromatis]|uniref:hypothetical protein n=1 Tax=Hymenobacter psoromatis TaxID=1484116 RepID=UPI001CBB73E0|nr:hypothetical protein [Hymenobacter psoromatis]